MSLYVVPQRPPVTDKVFVYGTLKKGFSLHSLLASAEYLGEALLKDYVMITHGAFPAICWKFRSPEPYVVKGEIYRVDSKTLENLDVVEGVKNGHYHRRLVKPEMHDECWVYAQEWPHHMTQVQVVSNGIWESKVKTEIVQNPKPTYTNSKSTNLARIDGVYEELDWKAEALPESKREAE